MTGKTYLVTGATRGIGAAIVSILLSSKDNKVIVGVRDVNAKLAKELGEKANVTVVRIDSEDDHSPFAAAKELTAKGFDTVDVIFANAGVGGDVNPVAKTTAKAMRDKFAVNTIAPLLLFEAFKPFLQKSSKPIFTVTSSLIASLAEQEKLVSFEVTAYAVSKTAANMVVRRIALEETWLTAFVTHPGLVISDMALDIIDPQTAAQMLKEGKALTTEDSARRLTDLVDKAELATHSGHFFDVQAGEELAW